MKTIEEFYNEIVVSKELQEELKKTSDETLEDFLAKHGCSATAKDFIEFLKSMAEGELEDDSAEAVNGGIYHLSKFYGKSEPIP